MQRSYRRTMLNTNATWLILALALSSCASPECAPEPPLVIQAPRLQPPPPAVMVPREPTFRQTLLDAFSPSPTPPTASSTSSPPAKQ